MKSNCDFEVASDVQDWMSASSSEECTICGIGDFEDDFTLHPLPECPVAAYLDAME